MWVDVFRARRPLALESLVAFDDVVTCLPVVQEVLQGFRCLIAACALRHDLVVLHRGRDFAALAGVSQLRERRV